MSKAKKGKEPEPVPVPVEELPAPVVEEPPKVEYNDNQKRVLFAKLPIKQIVSFHSGSILSQDDPVAIEVSPKQLNELKALFAANAASMTIPVAALPALKSPTSVSSHGSHGSATMFDQTNTPTVALPSDGVAASSSSNGELETVTEQRVTSAQLLNMILQLHHSNCEKMKLNKFFLQEVIDHYLPPCRDQTPPPPSEPVQVAAPVSAPPAKGGKGAAAPAAPVPPPEPVPIPGVPADGIVRVASLNESDFQMWYERFFADPFFYGQRMRMCAGRGLLAEVKQMLHRQCNINTANGEGLTSLHYACEYNRPEIVDLLIEFGGEALVVNAADKYGWTPLHCAVHHGNIQCVKRLLAHPNIQIEAVNKQGKTALHLGCAHNRGSIVFLLLSHSANITARDDRGMNPLHEAAYRGHVSLYDEIVQDCKTKGLYEEVSQTQDDLRNTPEDYLHFDDPQYKEKKLQNQTEELPPRPPSSASSVRSEALSKQSVPAQPVENIPQEPSKGKPGNAKATKK